MIKKTWNFLLCLSPAQAGLLIFLVSFTARLFFIFIFRTYMDLARYELERTAISLATTGIYGNPYAIPTGPTAHVSPGYTVILAAIFKLFGTGIQGEIVKQILACFVTSLQYGLLPIAARALQLDPRAALIAGLACAIYPAKPLVQMDGDWETPYTALFVLILSALLAVAWLTNDTKRSTAIRDGLVWGIALLFASVLLPVFAASLIVGLYFHRSKLKSYFTFAAIQVVVVTMCLLPWALRNKTMLGKPIFTRSNLGLELRVSNNDFASPDQRVNYLNGVYARYHPLLNVYEAEQVKRVGEVAYNREAELTARQWIRTHPQRYLRLTVGRVWKFWFYHDTTSIVKTSFLAVTGLLGLVGAVYLLATAPAPGLAIALMLLLYPAPNYFIHVGLRQRYPIDALLTLLSAVILCAVYDKWIARRAQKHQFAAA